MFFEEENNAKVLGSFLRKAEAAHISDESRKNRLEISREIISHIYKSPTAWDERCSFNIKHIGDQFLEWLRNFDSSKETDIDHIYCITYRFLCEFDFLVGPEKELSLELISLKSRIESDNAEMVSNVSTQIHYASYVMPASIAKEFINDANIGVFKNFEDKKIEAEKLKIEWDKELEKKKNETEILRDKLDQYKIGFNFVGLYQGFSDLARKKSKESLWLFWSLIGLSLLILAPLVTEFTLLSIVSYKVDKTTLDLLINLIPLAAIEIILIYFFRVVLLNHRSVKAQMIQIELRQTLCQFIQSYAEYSVKIKEQDSAALEKFETLIFSGVLSDPGKLPSTFDGVEQIANLVKRMKSS